MITLNRGSTEPLYLQVKAGILAQIEAGAYPAGKPLPTEAEYAKALGLSSLTVRRSIVELAQQGLVRRIPGRGTFIISGAAKSPLSRVSLLLPSDIPYDLSGRFAMHLMHGLHGAIHPSTLVLRSSSSDAAELNDSQGIVALWVIDPQEMQRLAAHGTPLVGYECAADPAAPAFDNISHANESGSYAAASSLINLGHTDIGCVIHATSSGAERRAGFQRAMRQHGLPVRPERIFTVMNTGEAGYAFGRRLLADPATAPTALVCSDDTMAVGILAAARELGVQVPESLSIVGFGDLGTFTTPALSSVRMDIVTSGRIAVQLLQERIANPTLPPRSVVLPTEYIRRASCGPPRRGV